MVGLGPHVLYLCFSCDALDNDALRARRREAVREEEADETPVGQHREQDRRQRRRQ
jgi:hypothetical protein